MPPARVAATFLSLPDKARNRVYADLLVIPHPLYIFQDPGTPVQTFAPDKPTQWPALLYVNRQTNEEASKILYSMNKFYLVDTTPTQFSLLEAFLSCIGPSHAGQLSHLCINFPILEGHTGNSGLGEDSLRSFKLLRETCITLSTLELHIHHMNSRGLTDVDRNDSQHTREALLQLETQLKTVASLEKIIIRLYDGRPAPLVMESMQDLGWIVLLGTRN